MALCPPQGHVHPLGLGLGDDVDLVGQLVDGVLVLFLEGRQLRLVVHMLLLQVALQLLHFRLALLVHLNLNHSREANHSEQKVSTPVE